MRTIVRVCALALVPCLLPSLALASSPRDRNMGPIIPPDARIAVVSSDGTGGNQVDRVVGDMMITALQKAGVRVVERQALGAVLNEQRLAQNGVVEPSTAPPAGKALGADYILDVKATEFGVRDNDVGGIIGVGGPFGGIQVRTSTARVTLDARLISCTTTAVMMAETAEGKQTTTGGTLLGGTIGWHGINLGGIDIRSKEWAESSLGRAARQAVDRLVKRIAGAPAPGTGYVMAAMPDGAIIVSLGSLDRVREGTVLDVMRLEPVRDSRGQVVWTDEKKLGQARVVEVQGDRSKAVPVDGATGFAESDRVRITRGRR